MIPSPSPVNLPVSLTPEERLPRITGKYLFVGFSNLMYVSKSGERYLHQLWIKDLLLHFEYLPHFTLCSLRMDGEPPEGFVPVANYPEFQQVEFVDLPRFYSVRNALRLSPKILWRLWRAIGRADIIHTGVFGKILADGWLTVPLARLRRRFTVLVVESAFWRIPPTQTADAQAQKKAALFERRNRWCVNHVDFPIFTQEEYRRTLLDPGRPGYVINASWIDEESILTDDQGAQLWEQKSQPALPLRLLFASRLVEAKGVQVLWQAIRILAERGIPYEIDFFALGPLADYCRTELQTLPAHITVRMLEPLTYGPEFFQVLQQYHAVLVPSLSDEQPRIVYDAYSQAVPIIASNTDGNRDCVEDERTGKLLPVNDAPALAESIEWAAHNIPVLREWGMNALHKARKLTHRQMHRERWRLLLERLPKGLIEQ